MRSPSSSVASRHRMGSSPIGTSRSPALRAGSARRWHRSARKLVPGAPYVLDAVGFDASAFDLVVTGEGRVDATTALGKAPGEVVRRAGETHCVVFGGIVELDVPGAETVALSGDPSQARDDLVALGRNLANRR